jgi:hypothetical protein
MTSLVMLSEAKHPHTGFLAALGMTSLVMLNDAKHPHTGFLATARNDITGHAERSEASTHWIPRLRSE